MRTILLHMKILIQYMYRYKMFIKYAYVGLLIYIVDFGILIVGVELVSLPLLVANTISFSAATFLSFFLNRMFTFRNNEPKITRQFILFIMGALCGLIINNSILLMLTHWGGLWYVASKTLAMFLALLWNYFVNRYLIFAR